MIFHDRGNPDGRRSWKKGRKFLELVFQLTGGALRALFSQVSADQGT